MTMFSKPEVAIGDRFTKVGNFRMLPVWQVARIRHESQPPHAHLQMEGSAHDTITVSIPALVDNTLFRRVAP
jgi:hypothetical protein